MAQENRAYALFNQGQAASQGMVVSAIYAVLAPDGTSLAFSDASIVINYGDSQGDIRDAMIAQIRGQQGDPSLHVEFVAGG